MDDLRNLGAELAQIIRRRYAATTGQPLGVHPHTCPDCTEAWPCADADCEPPELERLCNHCQQAYLK